MAPKTRANFDTFYQSLLTVFQVIFRPGQCPAADAALLLLLQMPFRRQKWPPLAAVFMGKVFTTLLPASHYQQYIKPQNLKLALLSLSVSLYLGPGNVRRLFPALQCS